MSWSSLIGKLPSHRGVLPWSSMIDALYSLQPTRYEVDMWGMVPIMVQIGQRPEFAVLMQKLLDVVSTGVFDAGFIMFGMVYVCSEEASIYNGDEGLLSDPHSKARLVQVAASANWGNTFHFETIRMLSISYTELEEYLTLVLNYEQYDFFMYILNSIHLSHPDHLYPLDYDIPRIVASSLRAVQNKYDSDIRQVVEKVIDHPIFKGVFENLKHLFINGSELTVSSMLSNPAIYDTDIYGKLLEIRCTLWNSQQIVQREVEILKLVYSKPTRMENELVDRIDDCISRGMPENSILTELSYEFRPLNPRTAARLSYWIRDMISKRMQEPQPMSMLEAK